MVPTLLLPKDKTRQTVGDDFILNVVKMLIPEVGDPLASPLRSQSTRCFVLSSGGGSDTVHGARFGRHVDSAHTTRRRLRRQQSRATPDRAGDGLEVVRHHRPGAGLRGAGWGGSSRTGCKQLSSRPGPKRETPRHRLERESAPGVGAYNKVYIY